MNSSIDFNKSILLRLECPACLEFMLSNIFLCENGHSCCGTCRATLENCPKCRVRMTNTRNYDLEGIAEIVYHPCEYTDCEELIEPKDIQIHRLECKFRQISCVATIEGRKCPFQGPRAELMNHILKWHSSKAWMREESLDRWKEGFSTVRETQFIQAYDELFYFTRIRIDGGANVSNLYWVVQFVGSPLKAKDYAFEIKIYNDDESKFRTIVFSELCASDDLEINDIISSGRCIGVPINILKTYKNKFERVWYRVQIKILNEQK